MRACAAALLIASAALAVAAAPALSAPRAITPVREDADIALAGSEAILAEPTPAGGVRIRAFSLTGRSRRPLLSLAPLRPGGGAWVAVEASAQRIAAVALFTDEEGTEVGRRLYEGPTRGSLTVVRAAGPGDQWLPGGVRVDGSRTLIEEFASKTLRSRATVLHNGGSPRAVAPQAASLISAFSGDLVTRPEFTSGSSLVVSDWRSGSSRITVPFGQADGPKDEDVALSPTGRVVFSRGGRLSTATPGRSASRVAGSRGLDLSSPRLAGPRIVALRAVRFSADQPLVLDPALRRARALGPRSAEPGELYANPGRAVWMANRCLLTARLAERSPFRRPQGTCRRSEVSLDATDGVLRDRVLKIDVTCVSAPRLCRGSVILRSRRGGPVVGRGGFRVPSGRVRSVRARLSGTGVRFVRRSLRREGEAALLLGARVRDGRSLNGPGFLAGIERAR